MLAGNTTWNPWEPAGAYDSLATVTVGSTAVATIDFVGIPTGYQHLQVRGIAFTTGSAVQGLLRVGNGSLDSGSNYSRHSLYGDGGAAAALATLSQTSAVIGGYAVGMNTTNPFAYVIDILDYSAVNKNKTMRILSGTDRNGSGEIELNSSAWLNTNAITTLSIIASGSTFTQYSTFSLYGVK